MPGAFEVPEVPEGPGAAGAPEVPGAFDVLGAPEALPKSKRPKSIASEKNEFGSKYLETSL